MQSVECRVRNGEFLALTTIMNIPKSHPRYKSLKTREKLVEFVKKGITVYEGLIAHGRGECFDYLLGEKTTAYAKSAITAACALLLLARNPVISVNGNVTALAAKEIVQLSKVIPAKIEINLFHRTKERVKKIAEHLYKCGAENIYNIHPNAKISGIAHARALCSKEGIYTADIVLIPLEDGDRAQALINNHKKVIAIDLNPLSRTAQCATITIVDELTRVIPHMIETTKKLKRKTPHELERIVQNYDNKKNLSNLLKYIGKRLKNLATKKQSDRNIL